jgi:hypothetical protein
MTFATFNFNPGLNKDDSPLASEGGYIDGDKVRFSGGRAQIIGGWGLVTLDSFAGTVRGGHEWVDLTGQRYIAFGTADKLYAVLSGTITDITPPHSEGVLTDIFTTNSGSAVVTVTHLTKHGFSTGMTITFTNQSASVGGLVLSGPYTLTVINDYTYTVAASSNASSTATGGGRVDFLAALPSGLVNGTGEPGGYGTGTYGTGGYGATAVQDTLPRVWFFGSWGETIVALPRGGGLYQYQPSLARPELVINGDMSSPSGWVLGGGWTISSGLALGGGGSVSQLSRAITIKAGYVYRVSFNASVAAGSVSFKTDAGPVGYASEPVSVTGTYSRRFRVPAGTTSLVFEKDASFSGSIDNVSITLEARAYRVDSAPPVNSAMFVDPHQIAVLVGTSPFGEDYNSMAVRWCDRQDIEAWIPTVTNMAGDDILAYGSRLVSGISTRQQNAIWSDSAMFTMQFTGNALSPFNFFLIGQGCGISGALARAEHNGIIFWVSNNNFYQFLGSGAEPVPCTLRRDVFDNIAVNQGEKINCCIVTAFNEWLIQYPDSRDGNECSRYVSFRWDEGHWSSGILPRTTWISAGVYIYPIAFGTDGKIYFHEFGHSAGGNAIDWFLETAYFDVEDGQNLVFIRRIIGDFEELLGGVNITIYGRMWPTGDEINFGTYTHSNLTSYLDVRATARQLKLRFSGTSAPAGGRWGALRLDIMKLGAQR